MAGLFSLTIVALAFIYVIESAVVKTPTGGVSNIGKVCGPVKCPGGKSKVCAYGYQKKDGCEICKCNDPCNPAGKAKLCGPNQRCHVEKNADGTFGTRCDAAASHKGKGHKGGKDHKGDKDGKSVSKADCNLPKVTGPCRAALPRFHYNSATKACESFTYGGCQGNANNFHLKADCETACKA